MKNILFILVGFLLFSCKKDELITEDNSSPGDASSYYFPDLNSTAWESQNIKDLNWSSTDTTELFNHLSQNGTRAFIILHKGKIVIEKYWGNNIQNNAPFDKNSNWYWASAGKTITAFLTGIDRKSTRLNSSHVRISYAVFCLKKKTKRQQWFQLLPRLLFPDSGCVVCAASWRDMGCWHRHFFALRDSR